MVIVRGVEERGERYLLDTGRRTHWIKEKKTAAAVETNQTVLYLPSLLLR